MKRLQLLKGLIALSAILFFNLFEAQVFWNEDFGNGCSTGTQANGFVSANGTWSVTNTGVNQLDANVWYISAAERGVGAGNCGTGCGGTNSRTLHVSTSAFGDIGAAYYDSGLTGFGLPCGSFGLNCSATDKRVESPFIDCSGYANIELSFEYIENGQGSIDNGSLWYYDGSSWSLLDNLNKTSLCGIQGLWTAFSVNLPPSADNNANVKLGFRWTNNDDGIGVDPSIAIDNIQLSVAAASSPIVQFASIESNVNESDLSASVELEIVDPSAILSSSVDVVLISGSVGQLNSWSTTTITFPAGSSSNETLVISLNDDILCELEESLIFELQNPSTGVVIGSNSQFSLNIKDDERYCRNDIIDDFESADLSKWTSSSDWSLNSGTPLSGLYSLESDGSVLGLSNSLIPYQTDCLRGMEIRWEMDVYYPFEPSTNEYLRCYLNNDGINENRKSYFYQVIDLAGTDLIQFGKVDDLGVESILVSTPIIWDAGEPMKRIYVDWDNGSWEIGEVDSGNGNDIVFLNTIDVENLVNLRFEFERYQSVITNQSLLIDEISLEVQGCPSLYYSQSAGPFEGSVWSEMPVGSSGIIVSNELTDIVIQTGHKVTLNEDQCINNLIIETGGELDMSTGGNRLSLFGDMDIDGTFTESDGLVLFHSEQSSTLSTEDPGFYSIAFSHGSELVINDDVELEKFLIPLRGTLNTNGFEFRLNSDILGTASIGEIDSDNNDVIGDILLERYIPAEALSWVAVGSGIEYQTLEDWNDDVITTGFPGADYSYSEYPFINIIYLDNSIGNFVLASDISDPILNDKGYFVYMQADEQLMTNSGSFTKGDFDIPLGINLSGLNVIVNPYPCVVDWDLVYANSTNILPVYWQFDASTKSWNSYNALTGTGSASRYIASSQSISVFASGVNAEVNFRESQKVLLDTDPFERTQLNQEDFLFQMKTKDDSQDLVIDLDENFSNDLNFEEDLLYFELPGLNSNDFGISTKVEDDFLKYDRRQTFETNIEVYVHSDLSAEYELVAHNNSGELYFLEDVKTNEIFWFNEELNLQFGAEKGENLRFRLYKEYPESNGDIQESDLIYFNGESLVFTGEKEIRSVRIFEPNGRLVLLEQTTNGKGLRRFDVQNLTPGIYTAFVETEDTTRPLIQKIYIE